jgi:hypothetical protein
MPQKINRAIAVIGIDIGKSWRGRNTAGPSH